MNSIVDATNLVSINKDGLNRAINNTAKKVLTALTLFQKFINSELYESFIHYFNIVKDDVDYECEKEEYDNYHKIIKEIKIIIMDKVEDDISFLNKYTLFIDELARFDTFIQTRAQTF